MKPPFLWKSGPMRGLNGACRKVFVPSCTKPALFVHDALFFGHSCTKPALSVHDHSYSVEESG